MWLPQRDEAETLNKDREIEGCEARKAARLHEGMYVRGHACACKQEKMKQARMPTSKEASKAGKKQTTQQAGS